MKKKLCAGLLALICACALKAQSIDPVSLIIAKAIKAIDLRVQRMQQETMVLQYAQQAAEQELSKSKLSEITGWQQQLSALYAGYFEELKQVKTVLAGGSVVKSVLQMQQRIVVEYGRMGKTVDNKPQYDALLTASMEILETLQMALSSQLSMKDAERLRILNTLKHAMAHCLESIQALNRHNQEMIVSKTKMQADLQYVKRLHGLK